MSVASTTALVALLNRLGGRTDAVAASRDLIGLAPVHLPLVLVEDLGPEGVRVSALNVEELMARRLDEEQEAMALLGEVVRLGGVREPDPAGGPPAFWSARDPRDVARQALQWALDHPELELSGAAFAVARGVLDA
ncbi:hypothetical protein GKE82_02590 [Conexibacter sp. W3-3-2]|uniref:hypothetical protein n=1 Tax=Solirubrobacterales TaxID=588673 RepID=UPI000D1F08FA|nr:MULTISPECIES: hypothetical protein [Solirubrobacterales]MTD43220.1 hypothetical protein [Conexibacter sp. W3-3-2]